MRPRAVVLCFGAEAAAYRVEAFPAYHADRPPMPDELEHQWSDARDFFGAFGWTSLEAESEGLEADDLLGALARVETAAGGRTLLFTGDRDMFQCVDEHVRVLFPAKGGPDEIGPAEVRERYGIDPAQVPDLIALRGDPSDGLPGAKGIGAKGAADLLNRFGTLEGVLQRRSRSAERHDAADAWRAAADPALLRSFLDIATLRPIAVDLPADAPLDRAAAAAAAAARGMGALAGRLESRLMFSWLAKGILTRNMARLREGDYRPLLRLDAKDIRFRFPGDSSWATEIDNRDDLELWLQRFVATGPEDLPGRGDRAGAAVEHDAVRARDRPPRRARGARLREPLRHLGPHVVGTAARVRGLRGHAGEQGARRVSSGGALVLILVRIVVVAALGSLAWCAPAPAAVTVGSDLSVAPNAGIGDDVIGVQVVAPTGATNPVTAPADGVVTIFRLRHGLTTATPGSVAFRILTPGAANTYTSRVASATATAPGFDLRFPLPSSFPAGPVGVVEYRPLLPSGIPAGVPIAAGESIGIGQLKGSGETATIIASRPGGTIAFRADGQLPAGPGLYSTSPGRELALQATIEPDADHDGLGDETQDQCPARANDAGGRCVPVEVPGSRTRGHRPRARAHRHRAGQDARRPLRRHEGRRPPALPCQARVPHQEGRRGSQGVRAA